MPGISDLGCIFPVENLGSFARRAGWGELSGGHYLVARERLVEYFVCFFRLF
jgi:hypothetical protein